ncbi:arginyltransferase [Methylogaea oryzae]|uniref:Aspartate/glutamate leucyltransferase n=1 Tax=Methylogaea oryzae TaxID=1295382 RepID=A0A8D4VPT9_9GAMM|nr:arginyltransferase [Methylogaea oryzae]BBL70255.1 putative arginyl-tRNA--protein transferase [Methylogaea oryzae]
MTGLPLLLSAEHDCSYLPERRARSLVATPERPMDGNLYSQLVKHGFRRSGDLVYRPHCHGCSACIALRVPVAAFRPNRAQRRCVKDNADLSATPLPAEFNQEHYRLYRRYLGWRHPDGQMADTTPESYIEFLANDWCDTYFVEFRDQGRLAAVAVVDLLTDGLSAVYTFYEPELERRGLGAYAVLWQIAQAHALGLDYLYLGYWIEECRKMAYKSRYRPFEIYRNGRWLAVNPSQRQGGAATQAEFTRTVV